jgi:signal transduction histidine kinase
LHALAECLLPAGFIHLALVFPSDRLPRRRTLAFAALYLPFIALALLYQVFLLDPVIYPVVHLVAVAAGGVSGVPLVAAISYELITSPSVLVRRRLGVVALGALTGFVMPIFLWVGSSLLGGTVPVNSAGLTAFLFPLSLAYGIVKRDLFEIDVMLRRMMVYASLVLLISAAYFGVLFGVGIMMPGTRASAWSPVALAVLNFGLLFMLAPLRERLQRTIDRVFFRKAYDIETALAHLSSALASPSATEGVLHHFYELCDQTVCPERAVIHLQGKRPLHGPEIPPEFMARLACGELLTVYDFDGAAEPTLALWQALSAELIIPLLKRERLIGIAIFGRRRCGHPYSANDLNFLKAALNQVVLALATADAFGQLDASKRNLERLNESLEEQVRDRTAALNASNKELNESLNRLQQAYAQLEQSQASLLRADRLATLGQLTAGIAHEMNTPLSAVLNALRIITELGQEYRDSIGDDGVLAEDHGAIAAEIISNSEAASRWAAKASGYIRSVKAHGRECQPGNSIRFSVKTVIDETHALLAHRLRGGDCCIEADLAADQIMAIGDPGALNQVFLNLVTNAIDAYEDTHRGGRISISASQDEAAIRIDVRDWAGGIPDNVLPHIFDELYTTKGPGRGTGLGLWITRNLVEERFGGTLEVKTELGIGTCFTLRLPVRIEAEKAPWRIASEMSLPEHA